MFFSLIIPVYNRPEEVDELLESLSKSDYNEGFEVVIIEDGSSLKCEEVVKKYQSKLTISYYYKDNSGPGDSRNYGMKKQRGLLYYMIPIVLFHRNIFRKWITPKRKLCGLFEVLIAPLIAFQIYKRRSTLL
jgi:glycosyltransferase involved in cell wall biosynthesis